MPAVELIKVTKAYGDTVIIPSIDLSIDEGEFVVIVGPSGCGKSTTLRMIAGLETISRGTVMIGGRDVTDLPPKQRDIAMVFQSYALYPHMNVAGNMSFALRLEGRPRAEIDSKVAAAASMLGITELLKRKPKELSGGQRQRVAMGRAIVREAYCFLFDEPLSNLDAKLRAQMRTELALLHKRLNKTMIYVTHDQIEAMTMADRIVVMSGGHIQQIGTPRQLYNSPVNRYVAGFIGSPSMNFLEGDLVAHGDALHIDGPGFSLPVPSRMRDGLAAQKGRAVVAGLRPEHFAAAGSVAGTQGATLVPIDLSVDVAEYIGSSQFLAARVGDQAVTAAIEVDADAQPLASGQYLFNAERLYLFDRETGLAL